MEWASVGDDAVEHASHCWLSLEVAIPDNEATHCRLPSIQQDNQ